MWADELPSLHNAVEPNDSADQGWSVTLRNRAGKQCIKAYSSRNHYANGTEIAVHVCVKTK